MKQIYLRIFILGLLISPFISFAQTKQAKDSIIQKREIQIWQYDSYFTKRQTIKIDTMHTKAHLYEPNGKLADYKLNLGPLASPSFSIIYKPLNLSSPFFLHGLDDLFTPINKLEVYNVTMPYSTLFYSAGQYSEQQVKFFHTQNITRNFNVGFTIQYYKTSGSYTQQETKGRNIAPFISYNGNRFSTYFRYAHNKLNRQETGGLINDSLISKMNTERITPLLSSANSEVSQNSILFVQKWNLLPQPILDSTTIEQPKYPFAIGIKTIYNKASYIYEDELIDSLTYYSVLHSKDKSNDTTITTNITNFGFLECNILNKKTHFNIISGLGYKYNKFTTPDYDLVFPNTETQSSFYESQIQFFDKKYIELFHSHTLYLQEPYANDYSMSSRMQLTFPLSKKHFGRIEVAHTKENEKPKGIYNTYSSNFYSWSTNLQPQKVEELRAKICIDYGNWTIKASNFNLENYIFFDSSGINQSNNKGNALSIEASKETNFKWLHMKNSFIYQTSEMPEYKVPEWATYNSVGLHFLFYRKLVDCIIGAEALYFKQYKVAQYIPTLGVFANQNQKDIGDFPHVNAFVSIRYKPIRLNIKYNGLYSKLQEKNFLVLHYPQSFSGITFSLTWLFYN